MKMIELINKNIKTDIFTASIWLIKLKKYWASWDMEDIFSKSKTSKYENSNMRWKTQMEEIKRIEIAEEKTSELEDRDRNYPKWNTEEKKLDKKLTEHQWPWENFKWPSTHEIGVSQGEKAGRTEKKKK